MGAAPLAHYNVKVRLASAGVVCCLSAAACLEAAMLGLAPKRPPKSPPQSTMLNANARNTSPARPAMVQSCGSGSHHVECKCQKYKSCQASNGSVLWQRLPAGQAAMVMHSCSFRQAESSKLA